MHCILSDNFIWGVLSTCFVEVCRVVQMSTVESTGIHKGQTRFFLFCFKIFPILFSWKGQSVEGSMLMHVPFPLAMSPVPIRISNSRLLSLWPVSGYIHGMSRCLLSLTHQALSFTFVSWIFLFLLNLTVYILLVVIFNIACLCIFSETSFLIHWLPSCQSNKHLYNSCILYNKTVSKKLILWRE